MFFSSFAKVFAAGLVLGSLSSTHVIMIEPHPYNLDTAPLLQTWPLSADLPFPCQGRYQHAEQVTTVTAGKTQTVKFWGSAMHGGGSCQFSVAYGKEPPQSPDKWHTIYSILGGCPAEAAGNIPTLELDPAGRENGPQCGNDIDKECVREFNVPIPKDMKNGPATFAWTWFNKIGNREMYMVCAPIIVTGGTDDSTFVDSLPEVFRANIPGECETGPSGSVIGFPDPGEFGKVYDEPTEGGQGACPAANIPDFDRPSGSDVPQAGPSSRIPVSSIISIPSVSQTLETPIQSQFSTTTPDVPMPSYTNTSAPAPVPSHTTTVIPENSVPVDLPATSDRPSWTVGMTPCPTSGALVCLEKGFFGICNQGWALPQPLAAGQKCVDGIISLEGI
ncbi:Fc.00g103750.m01.CDS01 [Cosmosporella sp. VM-42]